MPTSQSTSIYDCILRNAADHPERIALASEQGEVRYAELTERVATLASGLLRLGIARGDRIAVVSYPLADAYELHLALIAIGAIWVGINPVYKYPEMEYIVQDSAPVAIFFVSLQDERSFAADVARLRDACPSVRHLVCLDANVAGSLSLSELRTLDGPADHIRLPAARDGEDVAMIVYTSGSTGKPKGCMLRNKSMIHRAKMQIRDFDFQGDYPVIYNPWPMNHVGGIQLISAYAMVAQGTIVIQKKFDPERIFEVVAENRINILILLPTMFHMMFSARSFDPGSLKTVELFMFVGGSLSPEQIRRLQTLGQGKVQTNYGLSEGHSTITISQPGLDPETLSLTLGQSRDGEVRIVDAVGNLLNEVGQQGELQVKREFCMKGYLNLPQLTEEAFTHDGWLKTGDHVEVLPQGEMRLVGRISEMYKSGGYNIYPREIEMCLEEHPDVGLAAVVRRKDAVFVEVGVAFVVPKKNRSPSSDDLKIWCRQRIADYKVPKDIVVSDQVPLLPNNKINKNILQRNVDDGHF